MGERQVINLTLSTRTAHSCELSNFLLNVEAIVVKLEATSEKYVQNINKKLCLLINLNEYDLYITL